MFHVKHLNGGNVNCCIISTFPQKIKILRGGKMRNKSKNIMVKQFNENGKIYCNLYSYRVHVCEIILFENSNNVISITLGKNWDFSITTRQHIYDFLRDFKIDINNKNVVENAIENGFLLIENNNVKIPFFYDGGME